MSGSKFCDSCSAPPALAREQTRVWRHPLHPTQAAALEDATSDALNHDAIHDDATAAYRDEPTIVDVEERVTKLASVLPWERGEGWRQTKHTFLFLSSLFMCYLACWNIFS